MRVLSRTLLASAAAIGSVIVCPLTGHAATSSPSNVRPDAVICPVQPEVHVEHVVRSWRITTHAVESNYTGHDITQRVTTSDLVQVKSTLSTSVTVAASVKASIAKLVTADVSTQVHAAVATVGTHARERTVARTIIIAHGGKTVLATGVPVILARFTAYDFHPTGESCGKELLTSGALQTFELANEEQVAELFCPNLPKIPHIEFAYFVGSRLCT